jgi:hypothetical protein
VRSCASDEGAKQSTKENAGAVWGDRAGTAAYQAVGSVASIEEASYFLSRRGFRIPRDVSLISSDDDIRLSSKTAGPSALERHEYRH